MLTVAPDISVGDDELEFRFVASSGPGGQNVNKRNTKAVMHWNVRDAPGVPPPVRRRFLARYGPRVSRDGRIVIASDRFRDQSKNRADCIRKLEEMLLTVAHPPRPRLPTKPSRAAAERRIRTKKKRAAVKRLRRYPED